VRLQGDEARSRRGPPAEVEDGNWFFDRELLTLAQRRGMRIHEVPVRWVEDPDSRVRVVATAIEDLRGVARLMRTRAGGSTGREPEPAARHPTPAA
jgi:hypothetical protein